MLLRFVIIVFISFGLWGFGFAHASVKPLVTAEELDNQLDRYLIIDIRDTAKYNQGHIRGSLNADYFGFGWAQTRDGIPNLAPSPQRLADLAGMFGIEPETEVVVVSASDSVTAMGGAARMVWLLTYLGHDKVSLLQGGIRAWTALGKPLSQERVEPQEALPYPLDNVRSHLLLDAKSIATINHPIDARPQDFYQGWQKHPKSRIGGTLQGSTLLTHAQFIDKDTLYFVSPQEVKRIVAESNINTQEPMAVFCNTGWWASTTWLALYFLGGYTQAALYDGSMVEWTADSTRPVAQSKNRLQRLWREIKLFTGIEKRA